MRSAGNGDGQTEGLKLEARSIRGRGRRAGNDKCGGWVERLCKHVVQTQSPEMNFPVPPFVPNGAAACSVGAGLTAAIEAACGRPAGIVTGE